jgi:hypothetical protein
MVKRGKERRGEVRIEMKRYDEVRYGKEIKGME